MEPLGISVRNALSKSTEELNSKNEIHNELEGTCSLLENQMTMHHCDIRMGHGDVQNRETKHVLRRTDIICAQHVLHENSFMIAPAMDDCNSSSKTRVIVFDLLNKAKLVTFMMCTDSNNFVWSALKASAETCGWIFLGDAEKDGKIAFGPKSFVILERVEFT